MKCVYVCVCTHIRCVRPIDLRSFRLPVELQNATGLPDLPAVRVLYPSVNSCYL